LLSLQPRAVGRPKSETPGIDIARLVDIPSRVDKEYEPYRSLIEEQRLS
jgi:hypothetical protein